MVLKHFTAKEHCIYSPFLTLINAHTHLVIQLLNNKLQIILEPPKSIESQTELETKEES